MPDGLAVPVTPSEEVRLHPMPEPTSLPALTAEMLHTHALNGSQRQADAASNVAEQTRLGYLESKEKIGVREAQAMQDVRTSGLAREIVQARSVQGQPDGKAT